VTERTYGEGYRTRSRLARSRPGSNRRKCNRSHSLRIHAACLIRNVRPRPTPIPGVVPFVVSGLLYRARLRGKPRHPRRGTHAPGQVASTQFRRVPAVGRGSRIPGTVPMKKQSPAGCYLDGTGSSLANGSRAAERPDGLRQATDFAELARGQLGAPRGTER